MGLDSIAAEIAREVHVIWDGVYLYVASLALIGLGFFRILQYSFNVRLANTESLSNMYKEKLERFEREEAIIIAKATHARRADTPALDPVSEKSTLPVAEVSKPKVYVREGTTGSDLMGVFVDRTELQALQMLKPEVGKWLTVAGDVAQVAQTSDTEVMVGIKIRGLRLAFCYFTDNIDTLVSINIGQAIKLVGKIETFSLIGITLVNCQLAT